MFPPRFLQIGIKEPLPITGGVLSLHGVSFRKKRRIDLNGIVFASDLIAVSFHLPETDIMVHRCMYRAFPVRPVLKNNIFLTGQAGQGTELSKSNFVPRDVVHCLLLFQFRQTGHTGQEAQDASQSRRTEHHNPVYVTQHSRCADCCHCGLRNGLDGSNACSFDPLHDFFISQNICILLIF